MSLKKVNQLLTFGLVAVFLMIAALPLSLSNVKAQEQSGGGLRVPPGPINLEIYPGESEVFELPIRNITSAPVSVRMEVNDFESDGVSGDPKIIFNPEENNPYSIRQYVEGPEEFTLAVDEEKTLQYRITLPEDIAAGSRFGLFRFAANSTSESGEGVNLNASLGTIVLVNTPGNAVELVSFKDMKVVDQQGNSSALFQSNPEKAVITLANEGSTFVQPFGTFQVKNWNGDVVQEAEFNSGQVRPGLLPQSQREFVVALDGISGYGKYTIDANISYGDGSNIIPATITFWVIPWKLLLVALIVIVLAVIAVNRGLKIYKRNVIKSTKTEVHRKSKKK